MEYRTLPHGGEKISVIGMGSSVAGEQKEADIIRTVEYALDKPGVLTVVGGPGKSVSSSAWRRSKHTLVHENFDRNGHFFNFYRHLMQRQEKYGTIYHITCRLRMERRQSQKRIAKIRFTWGSDCTGEDLRKKEEGFS